MGKTLPQDKAAEAVREATREARATLGDLKRYRKDVERLVDNAFAEHVAACVQRAEAFISDRVEELADTIRQNSDACLEALLKRWAYIETACVAEDSMSRLIAMFILRHAGGTVQTNETTTWHLVRETTEKDGTFSYAFPGAMVGDADDDPKVAAAIRSAVEAHRPGIKLRPWSTGKAKGIDEL